MNSFNLKYFLSNSVDMMKTLQQTLIHSLYKYDFHVIGGSIYHFVFWFQDMKMILVEAVKKSLLEIGI